MKKQQYFTVTGLNHRYGTDFLKKGDEVHLVKEPENEYDSEAICVELEGLGRIGYVANSVNTRIGESMSAGRLYDRIGDEADGTVLHVMANGVVCRLTEKE